MRTFSQDFSFCNVTIEAQYAFIYYYYYSFQLNRVLNFILFLAFDLRTYYTIVYIYIRVISSFFFSNPNI